MFFKNPTIIKKAHMNPPSNKFRRRECIFYNRICNIAETIAVIAREKFCMDYRRLSLPIEVDFILADFNI